MIYSEMYIKVAEKCPAYNSLFGMSAKEKNYISCITCENFKDGGCIVNYLDIVAINKVNQ